MSTNGSDGRPSVFEEYAALLRSLPSGTAGSVELVARQLSAKAESLLRLASIPHGVDMEVAAVLMPKLGEAELEAAAEELRPLSFVIRTSEGSLLHDEVRAYLFGQWLAAHEDDPEKWGFFKAMSRRLAMHFEDKSKGAVGEAWWVAERQRVFHLIGADRDAGFAAFETLCRAERYRFRLESCEAAIRLAREYMTVFSGLQQAWLDYHEAKLESDLRHYDQARARLEKMLNRRSVLEMPALKARCLFRLAGVAKELRDFETAEEILTELRRVSETEPTASDQELRALQGLGSLYMAMGDLKRAQDVLADALMLAKADGRPAEIATAWNAVGLLHHKLAEPKRALAAYEKTLDFLSQAEESSRQRQVLSNIGRLHADLVEWEPARRSLEKSAEISRAVSDTNGEATALSNLGRVYIALGREPEARAAAERAIHLFFEVHNWFAAGMTRRGMARYFRRAGQIAEARAAFVEAEMLFRRASAADLAAEVEAELERLKNKAPGRSWLFWLMVTVGGFLAFAVLTVLLGSLVG